MIDSFDIWIGRNAEDNEIEFIQLMLVGKLEVELGGCLHFEIADEEQRQRLAETFKAAAEILTAPVQKPSSNEGLVQLHRFPDGTMGTLPPGNIQLDGD
jgi:hypothetical protein